MRLASRVPPSWPPPCIGLTHVRSTDPPLLRPPRRDGPLWPFARAGAGPNDPSRAAPHRAAASSTASARIRRGPYPRRRRCDEAEIRHALGAGSQRPRPRGASQCSRPASLGTAALRPRGVRAAPDGTNRRRADHRAPGRIGSVHRTNESRAELRRRREATLPHTGATSPRANASLVTKVATSQCFGVAIALHFIGQRKDR